MILASDQECTGCLACVNACPFGAIEYEADNHGFPVPRIDASRCKECGKCEKACPIKNRPSKSALNPEAIYAAKAKNAELQRSSSSGGIFGLLGQAVLQMGGVVYGAYLDEDMCVRHGSARTVADLEKFKGSKYVQSDIGDCYCRIKRRLENGETVLFSGTPCQVYGLKQFLGRDYKTLLTVDFICHGVPTPMAWRSYLDYHEKVFASKAISGSFRDKTEGWKNYSLKLTFENGMEYRNANICDPYLHAFIFNIMLRESCYKCRCKEEGTASDITLCDFWGVEKFHLSVADKNGVSAVLINSENGRDFYKKVRDWVDDESISVEMVDQVNPSRTKQTETNPYREYFLKAIQKRGFIAAYNQWVGDSIYAKISRKVAVALQRIKQ